MKILFTSTIVPPFVQEDINLLRKHFEVDHLITQGVKAAGAIFEHIRRADVTFTWFASVYSCIVVIMGKLLGKKSIIVLGGVDASKYPDIRYGIWLTPWKAVLVGYAIRNAYKILPVDPFLQHQAMHLAKYDGKNIECVPTGYDADAWFPSGSKEAFVLTVAVCDDEWRGKIKGLDFLFAAARRLATVKFVVIGVRHGMMDTLRHQAPENLEMVPFVEQRELLRHYQRAKAYCQPSYIEGLPNSLCEAMMCECVPVGTAVGGIPTAIGDTGFLVRYGDVEGLADAIQLALNSAADAGAKAREHIARNFSLKRREETLVRIVEEAVR